MPSSKMLAIPVQLLLFCISTALGSGPMGKETSGLSSDESSGMIWLRSRADLACIRLDTQ